MRGKPGYGCGAGKLGYECPACGNHVCAGAAKGGGGLPPTSFPGLSRIG